MIGYFGEPERDIRDVLIAELTKQRDEYADEARRQMRHVAEVLKQRDELLALADMWLWETVNERESHKNARQLTQKAIASVKEKQNAAD